MAPWASRGIPAVVLTCAVDACSGATSSSPPSRAPSRSSSPATSSDPAPGAAPAPITLRVEVDQPDGLATLDGALYVKTDKGRVVRVDPATGEVGPDVEVDRYNDAGHYCTG